MNISQVYAVYFSATGNTRKVTTTLANALAVSFDVPLEVRDFTLPAAREEAYEFAAGDLVVFGMPTYAGKIPLPSSAPASKGTASIPLARARLPAVTPLPTRWPRGVLIPTIWRSLQSSAPRSWAASCG